MKTINIILLVLFTSMTGFCQNLQYYELNTKKRLRKTIDAFPSEVIPKGEKLKILSFEDSYLKISNQNYQGYILLFKKTFKSEEAKKRIEQVIFLDTHNDLLKTKGVSKVPRRDDNTITVHTELPAKEAFKQFGNYLVKRGYTIESKDNEFKNITTEFKLLEYNGKDKLRYKLYVSFYDNKIKIKPKYDKIGFHLFKKKPVTDYLKNWKFKPSEKSKKNLLFWDLAPIIESFNRNYIYSDEHLELE